MMARDAGDGFVVTEIDMFLSVGLHGEAAVGKTSLVEQYSGGLKRVTQNRRRSFSNLEVVHGRRVALQVTEKSSSSFPGHILVFDVTRRDTFDGLAGQLQQIEQTQMPDVAKILLGNKTDLVDQRVVSREEAEQFALASNARYLEVTATEHQSVRDAFRLITETIVGGTSLHAAVASGRVSEVEEAVGLLGSQRIDEADWEGSTPLQYAALFGHGDVVEALVRLGSEAIDTPDNCRRTPMFTAASYGHASMIETLVGLGSKAIDTPNSSTTPLYAAALYGHANVIETLVRLGSKAIDTPTKYGCMTPMFGAADNGHEDVIEVLVRLGSKAIDTPNNDGETPLYAAASKGFIPVIELLVRLGSKAIDTPDNKGRTPILEAAANGHVSVIEALVRLGSKAIDTPNKFGRTPMFLAALNGHNPVIEALIRLGSNAIDTPNNNGCTPMHLAASNGHTSTVAALIRLGSQAGSVPDASGRLPIHEAASIGDVDMIDALLHFDHRSVDALAHNQETPVHSAAYGGHAKAVETLIRSGSQRIDHALVTNNDDDELNGITPLLWACARGRGAVVVALLELGSRAIDTPSSRGVTPLHAAAKKGACPSVIETLVGWGSRALDRTDNEGKTPLAHACRLRGPTFRRCARLLRALGADRTIARGVLNEREIANEEAASVTEDEAAELRFAVYFSTSLTYRLIFLTPNYE